MFSFLNGKIPMEKIYQVAVTALVLASILLIALWSILNDNERSLVVGEMFKLTYQFILIAVIGGLISIFAKKIVDDQAEQTKQSAEDQRIKAREREALDELRNEFLRRIVCVGQTVRTSSLSVAAFRSARSYRDAMLEILKARSELALIIHEIGALDESKRDLMFDSKIVVDGINMMSTYIDGLSKEFCSVYKVKLSELQIEAEKDRSQQSAIWNELRKLKKFGPLINYDQDFGEKRKNSVPNKGFFYPYRNVVMELRRSEVDSR